MSTSIPKIFGQNQETSGVISDPTMVVAYGKKATKTLNITLNGIISWLKARLDLVPKGAIAIYFGSTPPYGWNWCDGFGGRPNLSTSFPVGYNPSDSDYNTIRSIGGAKTIQLNGSNIPSHAHTLSNVPIISGSYKTDPFGTNVVSGVTNWRTKKTVTSSTSGIGTLGNAHENRPLYKTVRFIIKTI